MWERPCEDVLVTSGAAAIIVVCGVALYLTLASVEQALRNDSEPTGVRAAFADVVGRF